ncbi:MAG: amino acid ABC transporter permease [Ignavibacteriales bacterium]
MSKFALAVASLPYLVTGIATTLQITVTALAVGLLLGLPLAISVVYGSTRARRMADAYITGLRSVPVLVVIFIFYFVVARILDIGAFASACLALGLRSAAYQAEIFRGGIMAVGPGQMLAARALGMSRTQAIRNVVLPQAARFSIPAWGNEAAVMIKDSSFAFAIGVPELLRRAQYVSARTYQPFAIYTACAALYLILNYVAMGAMALMEKRLRIPG